MRPKALLFDFGGTLDSDGVTWLDRFFPIYRSHGSHISKDEFAPAFYASDDSLPQRHSLRGLGLEETVRLQVRGVLEILSPDQTSETNGIVSDFLAESRRWFSRTRPLLERWRERMPLAVVSNFYGNLNSVLESEGFGGLFSAVADSGVVGCQKPEPAIFLHALDSLGIRPEEACMVGDSLERDMKGAERLGMMHAWLQGGRPSRSECCRQASLLRDLGDLDALLERPATAETRP